MISRPKSFLLLGISIACLPLLAGCDLFNPISFADAVRLLHDPVHPDARRTGIAALSTRWAAGKLPPYIGNYRDLAQHDPDYTVRAMAIRALNICRDATSTDIFIRALQDDNEMVRLEGAKALANVPDPKAVETLIFVLEGTREVLTPDGHVARVAENKDVRIAAADALRQYRTLDVARTLIGYLNESEFGVAWQSRQSLITLTGQDLKYDESAWLQYLVGPSRPFG